MLRKEMNLTDTKTTSHWGLMLDSILRRGSYLILSDFERQSEVLTLARTQISQAVEDLQGALDFPDT